MSAQLQETKIRSASKEVVIGHEHPFAIIGERINPTGRRIFQEQLRAGDMSAIEKDVKAQVEGGADILGAEAEVNSPLLGQTFGASQESELSAPSTPLPSVTKSASDRGNLPPVDEEEYVVFFVAVAMESDLTNQRPPHYQRGPHRVALPRWRRREHGNQGMYSFFMNLLSLAHTTSIRAT